MVTGWIVAFCTLGGYSDQSTTVVQLPFPANVVPIDRNIQDMHTRTQVLKYMGKAVIHKSYTHNAG